MSNIPTLSICVPSRNRQYYFQKTIAGLLRNARQDVEFIFVDNSDDPVVMNDFMAEILKDSRVVYLPSTGTTLSMMDNWERTIAATRGEWVTFIGDDDFIDSDVAGVISRVVKVDPQVEAFSWGMVNYVWPSEESPITSLRIAFDRSLMKYPKTEAVKRMFGWFESTELPTSGYSIYHAAIRRPLLNRIYAKYNQRYFEHAVVDYDMAMKVICEGQSFVFCQRPFSVMGTCPLSNSFSIGRLEDTKKKARIFMEEFGKNFEDDPALRDFPFSSFLGVTATVGVVQQWFCKTYGVTHPGWEKAYARACALNTASYRDRDAFDTIKAGYTTAFQNWKGGRFLKYYQPIWSGDIDVVAGSGAVENAFLIRSDIAGVTTPAQLWDVVSAMIVSADDIVVPESGLLLPWQQEYASTELIRSLTSTAPRKSQTTETARPQTNSQSKRRIRR